MNNVKLKSIVSNTSKQELNFQRLNYSKIKRDLGWKPKTDMQIGLEKTISWYIKFYKFLKIQKMLTASVWPVFLDI